MIRNDAANNCDWPYN